MLCGKKFSQSMEPERGIAMKNPKLKILELEHFLLNYTDEKHPASMLDIIKFLEELGIPAERKSIYDDLNTLLEFGYDIQSKRIGRSTGYFIGERTFQVAELKLLVDSVQSSRFITQNKSNELIKKLESMVSESLAKDIHHSVRVQGRIKSMNESIYYNVDSLSEAIGANKVITFKYFSRDSKKNKIYRRNGALYEVSPWLLLWQNENYYLVAYDHSDEMLKHYRVDKMESIQLIEASRKGSEYVEKIDQSAYGDEHFGMFSGDTQRVTLNCEDSLAGVVLDRFGDQVPIMNQGNGTFNVIVDVAINVTFFGWLCGLSGKAKILEPEEVVDKMKQHVSAIAELYGC